MSGAALAKLGHPLGEANIARGCGRTGVIQMVSSNASLSPEQIADARISPSQPLFFQLYKHKDNAIALQRVRAIEALGYNAIFLTVDAPVAGNRERDVRAPFELEEQEKEAERQTRKNESGGEAPQEVQDQEQEEAETDILGTAGALLKNDDTDMSWEKVCYLFLGCTSTRITFSPM